MVMYKKCLPEVTFSFAHEGSLDYSCRFTSIYRTEILPENNVQESSPRLVNVRKTDFKY